MSEIGVDSRVTHDGLPCETAALRRALAPLRTLPTIDAFEPHTRAGSPSGMTGAVPSAAATGAAPARPLPACFNGDAAVRVQSSLVLFVGPACRPSPAFCSALALDGMRCVWLAEPAEAERSVQQVRFDAAVVDLATLGHRGSAMLSELSAMLRCPLVAVAAQADEIDEIVALELGAVAYLALPLAPRRLRAHLGALMRLRRPQPAAAGTHPPTAAAVQPAGASPWKVDRIGNRLVRHDRSVSLTESQCAMLECLFEAGGLIVTRGRLASTLPMGHQLNARSVDVYIHRLRRRLRDEGVDDLNIEVIRGRGYLLGRIV